jgi:hypothetical protein
MTDSSWVKLATYPSGFEADIAMAQLEASGIPAARDNNDTAGIFGAGFQGATSRGVTVSVPSDMIDEARSAITLVDGEG